MLSAGEKLFPHSLDLSLSPKVKLNEREKQQRIHTWLGEQTNEYLTSLTLKSESHRDVKPRSSSKKSREIHSNGSHKNLNGGTLLKSKSKFVTAENEFSSKKLKEKKLAHVNKKFGQNQAQNSKPFVGDPRQHAAATKIQATWRGFLARSKNPCVIVARHELRTRRIEEYIRALCHELSVFKEKQKADKRIKELQTEAIRFMWSQIRELQSKFQSKIDELEAKIKMPQPSNSTNGTTTKTDASCSVIIEKDDQLKETVSQLQAQVLQLQDALLDMSDKLVTANEDVILKSNSDDEVAVESDQSEVVKTNEESQSKNISQTDVQSCDLYGEEDEVFSARDNMPKLSLQNILIALDSSLTEKELWSLCEQALHSLKHMRNINMNYLSPVSTFLRKDGLISFADADLVMDTTYCAPELSNDQDKPTIKSLLFSLAVTMWSAADFNMTEDQAPCLSASFENLLVKMSHDDPAERASVDEVLKICQEHHSTDESNSLQICASLYAETCDVKKGKKRQIKSISMSELFAKDIEETRVSFKSNVVPEINKPSFTLKPAADRQLRPRPVADKTPHEKIMEEILTGVSLKNQPEPKLYTVKDFFRDNPECIQKLNILPGQRRRNISAVKAVIRKSMSPESRSPLPTPPQLLRAEVRASSMSPHKLTSFTGDSVKTLILRWQPSYVFDKYGNKSDSDSIIGYRIYVNMQPKGMVNGVKCRALLDGLKRSGLYKIHVCAVSSLGESDPSNIVIANLESGTTQSAANFFVESPHKRSFSEPAGAITDSKSNDSFEKTSFQSNDVVDRVLMRYGIKKPSSSSYSPLNIGTVSHAEPVHHSSSYKKHGDHFTSGYAQAISQTYTVNTNYASSSSSGDDHITPRTKALLEQLKDELLS